MRGQVTAAFQAEVTVQAADGWLEMTKACTALCKALKPRSLHVVLSDCMVRHACFPWRFELRSAQEDLAFAQLNFDDVYGANVSQEWHLAFSLANPGKSRLMVAIPKSLFALLSSNFSHTLPAALSITTGFAQVLANHQSSLPKEGWLVNVEERTVTFGSWTAMGWAWVNTVRASVESADDLNALLQQELTISGASINPSQLIPVVVNAPPLTKGRADEVVGVRMMALKTVPVRFTPLGVPT
jgi:hypothetical protein